MDADRGEEEGTKGSDGIEMLVDGSASLLVEIRDFSKSKQFGDAVSPEIAEERAAAEGTVFHIWVENFRYCCICTAAVNSVNYCS